MKKILYRLFEHGCLDRQESHTVLADIARGAYSDSQIAAFMTVYMMRSITTGELLGFRDALRAMRTPLDLGDRGAVDIVGTGGDNKNTFNISSAACFVVAAAGYPVVKHGNYAATSVCGASNLMESCGVRFTDDADRLRRSLDGCAVAYLHAPLFNPALKSVARVRREIGVRTFFNMLGPLANPAMPPRRLLGVYDLKLARLYNYLFQQDGGEFTILHSLDGYDEISLTGEFKAIDNSGEAILSPESLGLARVSPDELRGGETADEAAAIFRRIIDGEGTEAQTDVVTANAAYAIRLFEPALTAAECAGRAREAIASGAARRTLVKFLELNG